MNKSKTLKLMEAVQSGELSPEKAVLKLKQQPFDDINFAKIDGHRELRQGTAEVIYGEGKTSEQIIKIVDTMLNNGQKTVLITRLSEENSKQVSENFD